MSWQPDSLRCAVAACLLLMLAACASAPQSAQLLDNTPPRFATPVVLDEVPFFPQDAYQCGPAALATVLAASSVNVLPDDLISRVYVPEREGSLQVEMLAAPRAYGRLSYPLDKTLASILAEVAEGRPVLVMQNLGLGWYPRWHYAVVVGYDLPAEELILRSGTIRDYRVGLSVFERTWERAERWAFVVLAPGEMPAEPEPLRYFETLTAFERINEAEATEAAYRAGLQHWPADPALALGLGNLYYAQRDFARAREMYATLLASHPAHAAAHNNLAQVLLEEGKREDALVHAQEAVRLGGRFAETYQATLRQAQAL